MLSDGDGSRRRDPVSRDRRISAGVTANFYVTETPMVTLDDTFIGAGDRAMRLTVEPANQCPFAASMSRAAGAPCTHTVTMLL